MPLLLVGAVGQSVIECFYRILANWPENSQRDRVKQILLQCNHAHHITWGL